jgi:hypothetical protein
VLAFNALEGGFAAVTGALEVGGGLCWLLFFLCATAPAPAVFDFAFISYELKNILAYGRFI